MKKQKRVETQARVGARRPAVRARVLAPVVMLAFAGVLASTGVLAASQGAGDPAKPAAAPTLQETRLTMDKWIETQQIISKETREWRQSREILVDRVEAIRQEAAALEEKIEQAETKLADVDKQRAELLAEKERMQSVSAHVAQVVTGLEAEVRKLFRVAPETLQERMSQLHQRIPEDPATTKVQLAERFQNVIGILNELNKANNEINVFYEVRTLAGGRPAEVQTMYLGLAQAYYISAGGEAGIGRPTLDGWQWEPSGVVAHDVNRALEIFQLKQSPAFVALPVRIQ